MTDPGELYALLGIAADTGPGEVLMGPGVPENWARRLNGTAVGPGELVAATERAGRPVVVLGPGGVRVLTAVLDAARADRVRIALVATGNEEHRAALDALPWRAWPRIVERDLELVPPRVEETPSGAGRLVGGLGLVVVDATCSATSPPLFAAMARLLPGLRPGVPPRRVAAGELESAREALGAERERRERAERVLADVQGSASWRLTAPLRLAKRRLKRP